MRVAPGAFALAVLLSAGLEGQDIHRQSAILDSIVAYHRVAAANRTAFDDSLARARQILDTVRAGPLTVFVSPGDRDFGADALRIALDSLAPLGDRMIASLRGMRFVARRVPPPYWVSPDARPIAVTVLDHNNIEQNQFWEMTARAPVVGGYIVDHARRRLASMVHPALARWMAGSGGGAPVRFDTASAFDWSQLRLDLVSSPSPVARRCFQGSMPDCRHVLGFDSVRAPAREYFDSAGRRFLVERHGEQLRRRGSARVTACLAGADSVCVALLERGFVDLSIASIGQRVALLQHAIQIGGPDAAARVLSAQGTPEEQLAAVARLPIDSLVVRWHGQIRNHRVVSDNMSAEMALGSIGWIAVLGFLAMRNKRWR